MFPLAPSSFRTSPASHTVDQSIVGTPDSSRPAFKRTGIERTKISCTDRMPGVYASRAQDAQWNALTSTGRRALKAWAVLPPGAYPIQAPRFEILRGAPPAADQLWTGHKEPDGSLDISSQAVPRESPHLKIIPPVSVTQPGTYILDGVQIGPYSSLRDLKMVNLLAETLDLAV